MKFKVVPGTTIFNELVELKKKIDEVNKNAEDLAKELGGIKVATNGRRLAGGIDAIEFKSKPEGWRVVGQSWQDLYYPKADKKNKTLHQKIQGLPILEYDDLNKIVKFKAPQTVSSDGGGLGWVKTVGVSWGKEDIIISVVEGCKYNPPEGVVEILVSEYDKINEKINAEDAEPVV